MSEEITQTETERDYSFLYDFWQQFRKNRLNVIGLGIIGMALVMSIAAPVLAPYDPTKNFDAGADKFNPLPPMSHGAEGNLFILGTNDLGADVLSRLIYGSRTALQIGVGVVLVAVLVGVVIGAIAGYRQDTWVDEALMRPMDVFISFPSLVLAIGIIGVIGTGPLKLGPIALPNIFKLMLAIGVGYVPRFARITRGSVISELNKDYVDAAQVIGDSDAYILGGEILPNAVSPVLVQATLRMGSAILLAAGLSFLGLGVQPPTPSWGVMLAESKSNLVRGNWWLPLFPGLAIFITILGFNLLGDGIRDALDPSYDPDEGDI